MKYAKGDLKKFSNGTSTSPFPKTFTSTVKYGSSQGNQDDTAVKKNPPATGQK